MSPLDQGQLFRLGLVQTSFHRARLLQFLQRQNQQFGVVLVVEGRGWNGGELTALQPVDGGGVDGNDFLGTDVRSVLEVRVLPLLLGLQVQSSGTFGVLDDGFVDSGTSPDTLVVVANNGDPPIHLILDVPQDDCFDGRGHTGTKRDESEEQMIE